MGMSEFYGPSDDADSIRTLERALELGVNHFDSADTYGLGHNETLLGRFIAQGGPTRRQQVLLATKFGIVRAQGQYERRIDNSPAYIRAACEASLRRLGVEHIDLYYCHRRDPAVPIEDVVGAMADLVGAGKVRAIGLSEVSEDTLRRAHTVFPIAAVQSEYSLWSRAPESGLLAACAELGTTFVAYSPLGRAYEARQDADPFYREARFHSSTELIELLQRAGFTDLRAQQTLTGAPLDAITTTQVQAGYAAPSFEVCEGHGSGAFVVLTAAKV